MSTYNTDAKDWVEFAHAIEQACPKNANRDRFGRLTDVQSDGLRRLALKWRIEDGGADTLDQAAMIARKMLAAAKP
jgi:hypothetical protein